MRIAYPHPKLEELWTKGWARSFGATEPWTLQLVCGLIREHEYRNVVECGASRGVGAAWFALTLEKMGGGTYLGCEVDKDRIPYADTLLGSLEVPTVDWRVVHIDALDFLRGLLRDSVDFVWIDDKHELKHVRKEVELAKRAVRPGGMIALHDVVGAHYELGRVVKENDGLILDTPPVNVAGGVGLIWV